MTERLTSMDSVKHAERRIRELINAHEEWFYAPSIDRGAPSALRKSEIDFRIAKNRLILSCLSDQGMTIWRIQAWEWTGTKLLLEATHRMGAKRAVLELVPRAPASSIAALVSLTRRARCMELARLACGLWRGAKIWRAGLSLGPRPGQPGREARILLTSKFEGVAVTGTVAENNGRGVDAFLSSAIIWFTRVSQRTRAPFVRSLWLVAPQQSVEALGQRIALLRDSLRRVISLYEIDDEWHELRLVQQPEREELWHAPPSRLYRPVVAKVSATAAGIASLAPEAIDVVRARHGETLRFHGLVFARVRKVLGRERVWFGLDGERRRPLDSDTWADWTRLLRDLREHRQAKVADRRHALYRAAPEAWLESLLRRDISWLDPGLRLVPLHSQLRTSKAGQGSARPIDLLALRLDGRLAVIELKVSEDREHVLQGADYWQRIEAQRRWGNIRRARLFGDAPIADEPPLVYLVAPILRVHRAFQTLARAIAPEIEMYRFDINEDWRTRVRVMRRMRVN